MKILEGKRFFGNKSIEFGGSLLPILTQFFHIPTIIRWRKNATDFQNNDNKKWLFGREDTANLIMLIITNNNDNSQL